MFPQANQVELRKVTISSLVTCIYLPTIVTVISYKGLLYTVGNASSFYILVLIFAAESMKACYLSSSTETQKKPKGRNKVGDMLTAFGFLLGVMCCFFVGIILFGAPLLVAQEETLMLSALMTVLAVYPLVAHSGTETATQLLFRVRRYSKDSVASMLVYNAMMTVLGAWLGAVVIPLDWNTPWQQWPIPCYLGAIGGYLVANVYNVIHVPLLSALNKYPGLHFLVTMLNKLETIK